MTRRRVFDACMAAARSLRASWPAGVCIALAGGCAGPRELQAFEVLDSTQWPSDLRVDTGTVGGLSAADYDPQRQQWYLLSDDKSQHGPARFYLARIAIGAAANGAYAIDEARVVEAVSILRADGTPYPAPGQGGETADGESLRRDPRDGQLWWASEGDAAAGLGPSIRRMDRHGSYTGVWPLPPMLRSDARSPAGPRANLNFEAMSWDLAGRGLWLALEAPLYEDGDLADSAHGAVVRISLLDRAGRLLRQRAYRIDPVPAHAPAARADSGVSEILDAGADRMLVLERAGVETARGGFVFRSRLYCAAMHRGSEIARLPSLRDRHVRAVNKRLLWQLDSGQALAANYEAMGWGPVLPDGRATLLLVSDNNFDPADPTRLLLLATRGRLDRAWRRAHCPA